ncbi:radical SAM protein [Patescibacteria group bacterium]|nr:radical SAM protein [Patescibacteria group bacterium]
MISKDKQISLFIYPTYVCLGNCKFCFIDPKLRISKNDLTLNEIKNNVSYFFRKYLIKDLVLVGGEPLIYKNIIPLMDFLGNNYFQNSKIKSFIIASEALRCSSDEFINYLSKFFNSDLDFYSAFQISLNNFYPEDKFFKQRKKAILNLARNKFRVRFIPVFTKTNLKAINDGIEFLTKVFSKYYLNSSFDIFAIEPRLPFLPNNTKNINNKLFVSHPDYFFKTFNNICNLFFKKNIPFTLRNIPLCYLNKKHIKNLDTIYKKTNVTRTVVRIDKHHQLNKAMINSYNDNCWSLQKECNNCYLKDKCNGIDIRYIKKFKYPKLKPFSK